MSTTPFDDIEDLALVTIRDYKLDQLYANDVSSFEAYLDGFLLISLPDFDNCIKNLEDFDSTTRVFNTDLTHTEKVIIAKLMVIQWLNKEIQDVTQFQLHLTDTDFKHFSEAQNLKAKSDYRDTLREIVSQDMVKYGLKNTDWISWANGEFS